MIIQLPEMGKIDPQKQSELGAVTERAMRLNPHHPGWYYMIIFLNHYYLGYYKAGLFEVNRFNTPDYFWDPFIRTAVLSQLGNWQEAEKAMGDLLALVPDSGSHGCSLIQRVLFQDKYIEMIWEEHQKAGLEFED